MDHKKLFRALLACTSKDGSRGILQYIGEVGGNDDECTLCATDGHVVAVINVPIELIERAIIDDIIVKITNEYGTFYIDRKRKNINACDCTYPNVRYAFPALKPYSEDRGQKAAFRSGVIGRLESLVTAITGMAVDSKNFPSLTHYPVNKMGEDIGHESTMMHACILKEGVIGVMPHKVYCNSTEVIDNAFDMFAIKATEQVNS
jgi:hypothetical protein